MPEGDTIHRAARTLNTALAGRVVTRFETALAQLARRDAMRIVIHTDVWIAVAFDVPVAEFDNQDLHRIREHGDGEIANVLLDQRVVAGIDNESRSAAAAPPLSYHARIPKRWRCHRTPKLYFRAMPIILPHDLTTQEIRVLQEYRRLNLESMPLDTIKAIKHPFGGGEAPAASLREKGFLETNGSQESLTLTQKAKDFLAIDAKPEFEAGPATENAESDAT